MGEVAVTPSQQHRARAKKTRRFPAPPGLSLPAVAPPAVVSHGRYTTDGANTASRTGSVRLPTQKRRDVVLVHAAVRRCAGGHDGRREGDLQLHAELPVPAGVMVGA